MDYTWHIWQPDTEQAEACTRLENELSVSHQSALLLARRGITSAQEAREYIQPKLDSLCNPFLMTDMDKAVKRLDQAIKSGERIMIYGDYDVDGTTAVALVYKVLSHRTKNLCFYIPDRYTEGYGISYKGIDTAEQDGCSLIIALDCGIKAVDKVEYAKKYNIDFIICDHHTPGDKLPQATAVLNMKRADCPYPYKELSGCGVGFKLMQALIETEAGDKSELRDVLPLLAMSIASDIVPLTGENRVLAFYGLKQLNTSPSVGIKCLMDVAGITDKHITISDLVYKIGPRINASGRMHSGAYAVELLLSENEEDARAKADEINSYNTERRDFDNQTKEEALQLLMKDQENEDKTTTVVYSPGWHKGVIGIAASRLIETFYRPTIVLTDSEDDIISGSARSVNGFDIYSAIDSCRDILTNFGGHMFAAGLSMKRSNLEEFKERFEEYVKEHIKEEQKHPTLEIEQVIALEDITPQFYNIIKHLEPFGPQNPRPLFVTRQLINNRYTKRVGKNGEHLRLDITDRTAAITGIAFSKGDFALHIQNGNPVDICYNIEENTFNNTTSIQMMVQDIKLCSTKETHRDRHAAEEA